MKNILISLLLLVSCSLSGCHDFYYDYQEDDLWRLPLLEPYELKNSAGATESGANYNWGLVFLKTKVDDIAKGLNITRINVKDGFIYGYGTAYPCYHFIIDYKTKEETIYKQEKEWVLALARLGITSPEVHDVWRLFEKFKDEQFLPWQADIDKLKNKGK